MQYFDKNGAPIKAGMTIVKQNIKDGKIRTKTIKARWFAANNI